MGKRKQGETQDHYSRFLTQDEFKVRRKFASEEMFSRRKALLPALKGGCMNHGKRPRAEDKGAQIGSCGKGRVEN